jgi:hypothetical protein
MGVLKGYCAHDASLGKPAWKVEGGIGRAAALPYQVCNCFSQKAVARRSKPGYLAQVDWQQIVSLVIVGVAAGALLWGKFRPRKFSLQRDTHCGCASVNGSTPQSSIVFRARRGERPQITLKMK